MISCKAQEEFECEKHPTRTFNATDTDNTVKRGDFSNLIVINQRSANIETHLLKRNEQHKAWKSCISISVPEIPVAYASYLFGLQRARGEW